MDYEFRRDPFGGYRARFSMGHEAIGQWLIDEVGKDEEKIDLLFTIIDQLSARNRTEYRLSGGDYSLQLTHEEAEVKANVLHIDLGEDLDDLAYYDDEQLAMCGLEDFAQVLTSWRAFIRNEDMG
ncbi:MAG: YacL family protein [Aeromonas sp.]